jgi:hypothetical protein
VHQRITCSCGEAIGPHWQLFEHVHWEGPSLTEMLALKRRVDALGEWLRVRRAQRYGLTFLPWRGR